MARLREDARFKAVQPDQFEDEDKDGLNPMVPTGAPPATPGLEEMEDTEAEVWFDWAFVDFWKNNYCRSPRSWGVCAFQSQLTQGVCFAKTPYNELLRSNPMPCEARSVSIGLGSVSICECSADLMIPS